MALSSIRRLVLIALLTGACAGHAMAAYEDVGVGARVSGLGQAYTAVADDAYSVYYNPAGLATLSRRRLSFGYFKHLLDINSANVSWGEQVGGLGYVGGLLTLGVCLCEHPAE